MQLKEIVQFLDNFAPSAYQESYDNSGLLTGDLSSEITGALLCLDCVEEVIDEAIATGCNLVVAHHPIIFSGLKRLTGNNYIERTVIKAIKYGIAIYAAHTNLDNIHNGVNAKICEKLVLVNAQILVPKKQTLKKLITFVPVKDVETVRAAIFEVGAGHIGNYSETSFNTEGTGTFKAGDGTNPHVGKQGERHYEPEIKVETVFPAFKERLIIKKLFEAHPYEEIAYDIISLDNTNNLVGSGMIGELKTPMNETAFLDHVKSKMEAKVVRHTRLLGKTIQKVAVCGGSGSFLLPDAIWAGADAFVSADFKYHQFFDAEGRIIIADIGHYETEHFTTEIFHEILTKKFRTFAVVFSKISTNPINYY